jgi:hypothetical protein
MYGVSSETAMPPTRASEDDGVAHNPRVRSAGYSIYFGST